MKIVIDETLGNYAFDQVVMKPVETKNGPYPMKDLLERSGNAMLNRTLNIIPSSQINQIDFFKDGLADETEILYLYDPYYTSEPMLKKLQNWLFPEQRLMMYPIHQNRALILMIIDEMNQAQNSDIQEFYNRIVRLGQSVKEWIVSPVPKAFDRNKHMTLYKRKDGKPFKLLVPKNGKPTVTDSGSSEDLVNKVLGEIKKPSRTWVVQKEFDARLPEDESIQHYTLESINLPMNVPFLHVVTRPTSNTME